MLAFIESNFQLGIGNINASNHYPFADAFAPEYQANPLHVPVADFFPLTTLRAFQQIISAWSTRRELLFQLQWSPSGTRMTML